MRIEQFSNPQIIAALKTFVPSPIRSYVRRRNVESEKVALAAARSTDRKLLTETLLPALSRGAGRVLWVGCRAYTAKYPAIIEACGAECWTTDIDPVAARHGRPGRHVTGDAKEIDRLFSEMDFGTVFLNGVFGFGIDDVPGQDICIEAISRILRPGGQLLVGWNHDSVQDPELLPAMRKRFVRSSVPGCETRVRYDDVTHVYDVFRRAG